ncbi:hypothetical protein WIW89_01095 [Stygiolobus sp. CP850M]|uniref:hypothetical protein n=1 Tax=Stygiolobus sp. CP850M TaxID=3133134 RepID=UPI00307D821B
MLTCRREPYSELDEQCEGEDGFDEAPHVLEGSGLTTVDGMGREIRGMRTRGWIQIHEASMKVRPLITHICKLGEWDDRKNTR